MATDVVADGTEDVRYPHPELNLALLQRLHDELNHDLESMNTRLGVALAATLVFVSVAVLQVQVVPARDASLSIETFVRLGLAGGGYAALAIGAILFHRGLRTGQLVSAYKPEELTEPPNEHENVRVFVFCQIDLTYEAIMDRGRFMRRKGRCFNRGAISTGVGIALLGLAGVVGWAGSVWSNHV